MVFISNRSEYLKMLKTFSQLFHSSNIFLKITSFLKMSTSQSRSRQNFGHIWLQLSNLCFNHYKENVVNQDFDCSKCASSFNICPTASIIYNFSTFNSVSLRNKINMSRFVYVFLRRLTT